jgi:hypothetical protein
MKKPSFRAAALCLVMGVFSAASAGCVREAQATPQASTAAVEVELDEHLQGRIAQHLARLKGQAEQNTVALR